MPDKEPAEQNAESNAQRLLDFLSQRQDSLSPLLILTHNYPDPDGLAAAFALGYLAQQHFGITWKIAYGGMIGRSENRAMVKASQCCRCGYATQIQE
jgi:nanoRNase/pAp phosphatase (c-di-AMP/oligoRNAs hydrolase)